ncbi:MAG: sulfatase-like hydrolase/transferase [Sedimentisphaerales bacterium]|nr:sulfatase-like hydrolase/transferase [Sedimentisphaerales bacterium]
MTDAGNRKLTAAVVSAFFVLTVFVFAPSHVFLTNLVEFNFFYSELLSYLLLIAAPFFLLAVLLAKFSPEKPAIHQKGVTLILSLSFLLWLQGNILVWDYGLLRGEELEFNTAFLIVDTLIWAGVIIFVLLKSAFFYKHARTLSYTFIVIQLISTSFLVYKKPPMPSFNKYELSSSDKFTFSSEKNVIIVVLDAFQSGLFQEIIDEDSSYKDIFEGFTYFRNAVGGLPTTNVAVPNILTGQYYDNSVPLQQFIKEAYFSPGSIPRTLKTNGFQVDYFGSLYTMYFDTEIISNLKIRSKPKIIKVVPVFDAAMFRYLPDFLKGYIFNSGRWLLREFIHEGPEESVKKEASDKPVKKPRTAFSEKALKKLADVRFISDMMKYSNVVGSKNVFKYYHLDGCHHPLVMNEKIEYEKKSTRKKQGCGALKITKIFLDELRSLQVFDNSMIFVIADHGYGAVVKASATPLFLVKKFNGKGPMTVSDAPVSLSDLSMTIFSELDLPAQCSGQSVFSLKDSDLRTRRFLYYNWFTPGFDRTQEYIPVLTEYIVTGNVLADESWKATGNKFIPKNAEEFTAAQIPVFLDRNPMGIILNTKLLQTEPDFFAGVGENWSFPEDSGRWTTSQTASIIVNTESVNTQASLHLEYEPLNKNNSLSVYMNGAKIKDCPDGNNCSINCLTFKKGENIIELKAKLPPETPQDTDLREVCYNFKKVSFDAPYFVLPEWYRGFFDLEGTDADNWRWCSSEGMLEINNTSSYKRKIILEMSFSNYSLKKSELFMESDLFSEHYLVNVEGTTFRKELIITPGRHTIKFTCNADKVKHSSVPEGSVFRINNFRLTERSRDYYYIIPPN